MDYKKLLKEIVIQQLEKVGFVKKQFEEINFAGRKYNLTKGTFRLKADKDDAWLFELARHQKVIFDVGSNIGQAAILMLSHDNVEKIVLIDPNPKALSQAAENLIMNNLSGKAYFIPAFISDKVGDNVELYTVGVGAAGSTFRSFAKTANKVNSHFSVSTLTLDYISDHYNLIPDLVKIDVEGAEIDVLNGALKLASKHETVFFVEVHSGPELSITKNTELILDWCQKHNYKAWYLKEKSPLKVESILTRGRYHTLLLPGTMGFLEYLEPIDEGAQIIQG